MEELGINQRQGSQAAAATQLLATSTGDSDSQGNICENSQKARRDKNRKNDERYRDNQKSNSMDQVTEQLLDQPADSREGFVIDQGQGSQAPAPTQPLTSPHLGQTLATSTGDSDSQRNIGENSEEARREKKRERDREYRKRERIKRQALKDENYRLKQENDKQKQQIKSMREEVERLKWQLGEMGRQFNSLPDSIGVANEQSVSITYVQQRLARVEEDISSLTQKVDGLPQNIVQHLGTQVCPQPREPQRGILISEGSQAAATTLPLTHQPSGTGGMQQTCQSHGLPDFQLEENLGQTADPIFDGPPEFGLHQGQGGNTAVESQLFTQGLSDQIGVFSENFDFGVPQGHVFHCRSIKIEQIEELEAENTRLKREDQQMKSAIEAFKAEQTKLKHEIEGKEQLIKSYLEVFEAEIGILMPETEKKEQMMKNNREAFEAENGRLQHEIEEKERLMKSNMEAFEVKNGKLKLEIGEEEQPMNLESFEAKNERLKHEIEETKQLMKSNLEAFEAQNGRLEHEIQAKKQLMKSNLETLKAQIRQLVDEFESLNVANVPLNLRMQTHQGN